MSDEAPPRGQFLRSMPVLEATDMARSIAFYRDQLGFHAAVWGEPPSFAIMQRGEVTIALDASQRGQAANNQWWAAYIYVADVNALYKEFKALDIPIHREICDAEYGCRDFDVIDPDGYILAFGQVMAPGETRPGLGSSRGRDGES